MRNAINIPCRSWDVIFFLPGAASKELGHTLFLEKSYLAYNFIYRDPNSQTAVVFTRGLPHQTSDTLSSIPPSQAASERLASHQSVLFPGRKNSYFDYFERIRSRALASSDRRRCVRTRCVHLPRVAFSRYIWCLLCSYQLPRKPLPYRSSNRSMASPLSARQPTTPRSPAVRLLISTLLSHAHRPASVLS